MALEAIYNQLQNKRRNRSKKKYEDELFLLNQNEHLNIINNLVNRSNQLKSQDTAYGRMNEEHEPLQIESSKDDRLATLQIP
jgi:bisphosphoglycerate-dependent phosphoglycerate mutase